MWQKISVLFKKCAKWHKINLSSVSVKLPFLANGWKFNQETKPTETIWEVLSDYATGFDETYSCGEKNGIVSRWSGKKR